MKKFYRIKEVYRYQPWYTSDVYELLKIYEERQLRNFGTDCLWKSINTGFKMNRWNSEFEELPKEECIEINRKLKITELID